MMQVEIRSAEAKSHRVFVGCGEEFGVLVKVQWEAISCFLN